MVGPIKAYTAIQNLSPAKGMDKAQGQKEETLSRSAEIQDEVVLSSNAQDVTNILNLVQKSSEDIEANNQLTLARNAQALEDLLKS